MQYGIYWNTGKRPKNQDSLAFHQLMCKRGEISFAVVADGIGGLQQGELASGYVVEQLVDWFYGKALPEKQHFNQSLFRSLDERVARIGQELEVYGEKHGLSLGTTCTCVLVWRKQFFMLHVGDTKAYLLQGKKVVQLTTTHVDGKGALTKCIGSMGYYEPDYCQGKIGRNSSILLCSDGVWKKGETYFSPLLLPKEMRSRSVIERRLKQLCEQTIRLGERDNQAAIYLAFS